LSEKYIKRKKMEKIEKIAEEHADWFVEVVVPMFKPIIKETAKTFFIHGYKHGVDEKEQKKRE